MRPFQQPATGLHLLWQISSLCSYSVSREVRYKLLSSYLHINKNKLQSFTLLKYYVQQQRLLLLKSSASIFQCTCFPLSHSFLSDIFSYLVHTSLMLQLPSTLSSQPNAQHVTPSHSAFLFIFPSLAVILLLLASVDNLFLKTGPKICFFPNTKNSKNLYRNLWNW